jgi:hypothetical protein
MLILLGRRATERKQKDARLAALNYLEWNQQKIKRYSKSSINLPYCCETSTCRCSTRKLTFGPTFEMPFRIISCSALWRVLGGTSVGCVYFLNLPDDMLMCYEMFLPTVQVTSTCKPLLIFHPQNSFKNCP